jgi:hypothetical protein
MSFDNHNARLAEFEKDTLQQTIGPTLMLDGRKPRPLLIQMMTL